MNCAGERTLTFMAGKRILVGAWLFVTNVRHLCEVESAKGRP